MRRMIKHLSGVDREVRDISDIKGLDSCVYPAGNEEA